jgi:hypothetical protein
MDTLTNRSNAVVLSNLPNYTEFTSLFDAYKISHVKALFIWDMNSAAPVSAVGGVQTNFIPNLLTVLDNDDATPLASVADYCQYESFKVTRLDRPVTISFVPKVAGAIYAGGAFTGYSRPAVAPWIDAATVNAESYGLKYAVNGGMEGGAGTRQLGELSIYWTYTLQCKDVR